ncbi:MAG: peptide ABC transporter substrate-binding protein [Firmicutes bacterium]|nr:peptide ABC transporter substrate-binding protein [Bacillota bacterium]
MLRKRVVAGMIILLLLLPLAGCTNGEEGEGRQFLNINLGENPPDLDPQRSTDSISADLLNAIFEGLMRADQEGVLQPGLAADFPEISEDRLTYTFTLREGLTWSDGEPLTAADFEFAWKRAMSPLTASEYSYLFDCIARAEDLIYFDELPLPDREELSAEEYEEAMLRFKGELEPYEEAVGVKALDRRTLQVELVQPTPHFLDLCSFLTYLPAPRHLVERYGEDFATAADKIAASGPFKMESWEPDAKIVLVKNERYWDRANVSLEKINLFMLKEISTEINMYETGELDSIIVPGDYLEEYRDDPGFGSIPEAVCRYLLLNHEDPVMANHNFRRALSYGFDRGKFIEKVLQDPSLPATAFTPPTIKDQEGNSFNKTWVKDKLLPEGAQLDLAREYLKRALEELGLDEVGELAVTLLCGDSESHKKYAEGVQGLYRESLGLKIKVESVDFATFLERIRNRQFSLMYLGWNADFNDPSAFMDLWITDGPYNDAGYSNEIYDTAIEIARSGTDNKTRMEALAEAERILCEDLPIIPLYWPTRNYITRPYVKDWVRRITGADNEWKYCRLLPAEK